MSTIVVIKGLAIIAGSNFSFLATIGNKLPTTFAIITVQNKLKHTVIDMANSVLSNKYILRKFTLAKTVATIKNSKN